MALTLPSLPAGHDVTAADMTTLMNAITQAYGIPLIVGTNQSANLNSTTLQDITAFVTTLSATSTTYRFEGFIYYTASTTGDMKLGISVPASATAKYQASGALPTDTVAGGTFWNGGFTESAGTPILGGTGTGTAQICRLGGSVTTAGSTGTFKFQFAQNTADAVNATTIFSGSWLTLWQV